MLDILPFWHHMLFVIYVCDTHQSKSLLSPFVAMELLCDVKCNFCSCCLLERKTLAEKTLLREKPRKNCCRKLAVPEKLCYQR